MKTHRRIKMGAIAIVSTVIALTILNAAPHAQSAKWPPQSLKYVPGGGKG